MEILSPEFKSGDRIPEACAFARPDASDHCALSANRNPELHFAGVPGGARSLVLLCVDRDVPSVGDDVNQEGRTVSAELARTDFYHWVMVDIPADCTRIAGGTCSDGVTPHGKTAPPGPAGSRQGRNDYTGWFASDPDMAGTWLGYDGPAPPWNDERVHHYHFRLFATDLDRCPVEGAFEGAAVLAAIEAHVLAEATLTGTYTLNPALLI